MQVTWNDCFTSILFGVFTLLFGHRNAHPRPISPQTPNPLLFYSLTHTHTHTCTAFTLIGIDIGTVWRPLIGDEQLGPAGPSWTQLGPLVTPIPPPSFFLFRGGGGWTPLVKWIKIPNNSNNNDNKKLIKKNGMFLPDCAGCCGIQLCNFHWHINHLFNKQAAVN